MKNEQKLYGQLHDNYMLKKHELPLMTHELNIN